jgi:hypothetical protein
VPANLRPSPAAFPPTGWWCTPYIFTTIPGPSRALSPPYHDQNTWNQMLRL